MHEEQTNISLALNSLPRLPTVWCSLFPGTSILKQNTSNLRLNVNKCKMQDTSNCIALNKNVVKLIKTMDIDS